MSAQDVARLKRLSLACTENQIVSLPIRTSLQSCFRLSPPMLAQVVQIHLRNGNAAPATRGLRLNESELIRVIRILKRSLD